MKDCKSIVDEFSMILYHFICKWMINKINNALQKYENFQASQPFIGILDFYGFNENTTVSVDTSDIIVNTTNESIYNLSRKVSLSPDLSSETVLPFLQQIINKMKITQSEHGTTKQFITEIKSLNNHEPGENHYYRIYKLKNQENQYYLEVDHYFQKIFYNLTNWWNLTCQVDNEIIQNLFNLFSTTNDKLPLSNFKKLTIETNNILSIYYFSKLYKLIEKIKTQTTCHFVCCIRPSEDNQEFNDEFVLKQVKTQGIFETLNSICSLKSKSVGSRILPKERNRVKSDFGANGNYWFSLLLYLLLNTLFQRMIGLDDNDKPILRMGRSFTYKSSHRQTVEVVDNQIITDKARVKRAKQAKKEGKKKKPTSPAPTSTKPSKKQTIAKMFRSTSKNDLTENCDLTALQTGDGPLLPKRKVTRSKRKDDNTNLSIPYQRELYSNPINRISKISGYKPSPSLNDIQSYFFLFFSITYFERKRLIYHDVSLI